MLMDLNTLYLLVAALTCVASGLLIGLLIGRHRLRRRRSDDLKALNARQLDLLDSRAECERLRRLIDQTPRKERLIVLLMRRMADARAREQHLMNQRERLEKAHFVREARLKMAVVTARESAVRAAAIARRATAQLKRLEAHLPATQTIQCPQPKSYDSAEAVTVSVVDASAQSCEAVSRMSNRDSARLTCLGSSNESECFDADNLQAIRGIDPDTERSLNEAGIHRVEQLANLSPQDLEDLNRSIGLEADDAPSTAWIGEARQLISRREHV